MDKISGIIPASARVTSVDMKNSGVARSGGPSFGRPQGVSTAAKQQIDLAKTAAESHAAMMDIRQPGLQGPKDPNVDIVEKITRDFFGRPKEEVGAVDASPVEKPHDYGPNADLDPRTSSREDLDMPEVGAYLDVQA